MSAAATARAVALDRPAPVRIFVINLESAHERRASMTAQLAAFGLEHAFFKAIEPARALEFFDGYDERRYLANTGRTATPSEMACFASHRCVWRECVAIRAPIVVLEDDAELLPAFPAALETVTRLADRYGFMRLQDSGPSRHVRTMPVESAGAFTVLYYASCPYGSMGYALSPEVAGAFLEKSAVVSGPVDLFLRRFWEHGRPLFALSPFTVGEGAHCGAPTIAPRNKSPGGLRLRAARLLNKLEAAIGRARFNRAYAARRVKIGFGLRLRDV